MFFELHLVRKGLITSDQFVTALEKQLHSRPQLGSIAMELKALSVHQVFEILKAQVDVPESFGQTAIRLGFMSVPKLAELLMEQQDRQPPISDILMEMGVLSNEVRVRELSEFRRLNAASV